MLSSRRGYTQAAMASCLLLLSQATLAVNFDITTDTTATINLEGSTNDRLTIKAVGGSLFTTGTPAVNSNLLPAFNGAGVPTNTIVVENSVTKQPADISSDLQAILIDNANTNNKSLTTNITFLKGSIIQSTGAKAVIEDQSTKLGTPSIINFRNDGVLSNLGTGSGFVISSAANAPTTLVTFNNTETGQISVVGDGAIAVDLNKVGALTNPIFNSGFIYSKDSSAIKSTIVNQTLNIAPGTGSSLITGKGSVVPVVDFGVTNSPINMSGGAVNAEAITSTAIKTGGAINITGGSIFGKIVGDVANTTLAFNLPAGVVFNSTGALDSIKSVTVNSGTLALNSNVTTSGFITVNAPGAITVRTPVSIFGKLQMIGAKATFDLSAPELYGKITVGAPSDFTNANLVISNNGNGYIPHNTQLKIVDGNGNNLTTFGVTNTYPVSAVYNFTTALNAQDITLTVLRTPLNTFGQGGVHRLIVGLGNTLEFLGQNGTANSDILRAIGELGRMQTSAQVEDAMRQMIPPANQMEMQAAISSSSQALDVVASRLKRTMGYNSGDFFSQQQLWGQTFGNHTSQQKRGGIIGFSADTAGLTLGTDAVIEETARIGVAGSYATTTARTRSNPRNTNALKTMQLTLYGANDFGCGWVDGMVSVAKLRHKSLRRMRFGALSSDARNIHSGVEWTTRLGYGHQYTGSNGFEVMPSIALSWIHLAERSYTEKDAGGLNLRIFGHDVDFVDIIANVKYAYPFFYDSKNWVPDFNVGIKYIAISKRDKLNARFATNGTVFTVVGLEPTRVAVMGGVGLSLLSDGPWTFRASLDVERKRQFVAYSGFLNARYAF